jgi:transcriptional regulator
MASEKSGATPLQGTLELLVLHTLSPGPLHGYAIAQQIGVLSEHVLKIEQGSLYPALERLQRNGWVTSAWKATPTGRFARYYTITRTGRKQLGEKMNQYDQTTLAISRVLGRD